MSRKRIFYLSGSYKWGGFLWEKQLIIPFPSRLIVTILYYVCLGFTWYQFNIPSIRFLVRCFFELGVLRWLTIVGWLLFSWFMKSITTVGVFIFIPLSFSSFPLSNFFYPCDGIVEWVSEIENRMIYDVDTPWYNQCRTTCTIPWASYRSSYNPTRVPGQEVNLKTLQYSWSTRITGTFLLSPRLLPPLVQ